MEESTGLKVNDENAIVLETPYKSIKSNALSQPGKLSGAATIVPETRFTKRKGAARPKPS